MSQEMPKAGTVEFAHYMCDHFAALSGALKDLVGDDYGEYCSMMFGVRVDTENARCVEIRANGGLRNSVRVCANVCNLAAINLVKNNPGMTVEDAVLRVLEDLKHDMLSYRPEPIPHS